VSIQPFACLMYHDTPPDAAGGDYFAVSRASLREQLLEVRAQGRAGVSLESRIDTDATNQGVAITFDDGYESNLRVALPVFADLGMSATVFVVTEWVGTSGYCTWAQLQELQRAGWSIQSHTASHPFLSTLSEAALRHELADARREIEDRLGQAVVTLALPNGDWPPSRFRHLVQSAGYRYIASSRWHSNSADDVRRGVFGRYTVRRSTTMAQFRRILTELPGSWSGEGMRLSTLSAVRRLLGPHRYRDLRRQILSRR
jgi:peptidoglycan/xylan/chitin deacetylase (PgdA/CDA1 family)